MEALAVRFSAIGEPLYAVFGGRRRDLAAHVLAHLEEMNAIDLHVPPAAVRDLVADIDLRAVRSR